jgi:hypothetical protein
MLCFSQYARRVIPLLAKPSTKPRISCLLRILSFSAAAPEQSRRIPQTLTVRQDTPLPIRTALRLSLSALCSSRDLPIDWCSILSAWLPHIGQGSDDAHVLTVRAIGSRLCNELLRFLKVGPRYFDLEHVSA